MKLPTVSTTVLYNDGVRQNAAMVVGVNMAADGISADSVNLKIFTDSTNGLPQYMRNVPQGDIVGTWQWPDIEIDRSAHDNENGTNSD